MKGAFYIVLIGTVSDSLQVRPSLITSFLLLVLMTHCKRSLPKEALLAVLPHQQDLTGLSMPTGDLWNQDTYEVYEAALGEEICYLCL